MRGARTAGLASALVSASLVAAGTSPPATAGQSRPAVVSVRVIGHSVQGRPIYAWRVGDPHARVRAVVMAVLHGNESAPRQLVRALRDGPAFRGLDLWLLPTVNPDGLAHHSRRNAHGVDLNRNFAYHWTDLDGSVESGPRPASEPETRAVMRFVSEVRPRYVVSFHQPLHGVDTSVAEARPFARRLARGLRLPTKPLVCGGVCHGTFTEWFMHRFPGTAVTVEYGAHPGRHRMRVTAPRRLLRVLGASR
ncbi:MAG: DUF2817 domain-containing protein [Nocardioidaceae bacterium]